MKYEAILSKKQMFSFRGQRFKANDGILIVEDKEVMAYLDNNPYWKKIDVIEKEIKHKEDIKHKENRSKKS